MTERVTILFIIRVRLSRQHAFGQSRSRGRIYRIYPYHYALRSGYTSSRSQCYKSFVFPCQVDSAVSIWSVFKVTGVEASQTSFLESVQEGLDIEAAKMGKNVSE